jgi:hypothetical protein
MRSCVLLLVVFAVSLLCAQNSVGNSPEYDPVGELQNDSWFVANVIPSGGTFTWVSGLVDQPLSSDPGDWFQFAAFAGDELDFTILGTVDAIVLDIDHETTLLTGSGSFVAPSTGDYFVYVTATDLQNYIFTLTNHTSPTLPVELTSFNAMYDATSDEVTLKWTTATETDLRGYHVYRGTETNLDHATIMNVLIEAQGNTSGNSYQYSDNDVQSSTRYYYWIESVDMDGHTDFHGPAVVLTSGTPEGGDVPDVVQTTRLIGAYPNPFNPSTSIAYYLTADSDVALDIFNLRGEQVAHFSSRQTAGAHYQAWSPTCGSGNYLIRMKAGSVEQVKMATLLK